MGKKIQAAKASLVAAFLAAGGGAVAKSLATPSAAPAAAAASASDVSLGDQLVRFLKLDGFPAYLKAPDFAQLENFYKPQLVATAGDLYLKYDSAVEGVLSLYQKANAGPLTGILIGLEKYWKQDDLKPLLDYLKGSRARWTPTSSSRPSSRR